MKPRYFLPTASLSAVYSQQGGGLKSLGLVMTLAVGSLILAASWLCEGFVPMLFLDPLLYLLSTAFASLCARSSSRGACSLLLWCTCPKFELNSSTFFPPSFEDFLAVLRSPIFLSLG